MAALHAASWRRYYRGAYADAYLDGDIDADRLAVWTARLAATDPRRVTIVAEADSVAQASAGPAPAGAGPVTVVATIDAVAGDHRPQVNTLPVADEVEVPFHRLPQVSTRPACGEAVVPFHRLPQVSTRPVAGQAVVPDHHLPQVSTRPVADEVAAPYHHVPRARDGAVPTGGETRRCGAAGDHDPPLTAVGDLATPGDDRLVAITSDTAWRTGAAGESDTRHMAAAASTLVGFVHLVVDDDPRWGSLIDNLMSPPTGTAVGSVRD
ncbi:hypothetical protein Afe04nite_31200 [Asanoa ferruginea]|nr:hypothetical protein Afe04nite_31200 [Asanoa ferruginea]